VDNTILLSFNLKVTQQTLGFPFLEIDKFTAAQNLFVERKIRKFLVYSCGIFQMNLLETL
jgi:hypothetical protein